MTTRPGNLHGVTVDLVILTVRQGRLHTLLVPRDREPFAGRWALPGGFLTEHETLDEAAARQLREKTGLTGDGLHLEQLRTYGAPDRDPRGRVISVAYLAVAPGLPTPPADAAPARWEPIEADGRTRRELAFDHAQILSDGVERARSKLEYTPLAAAFCTEPFTISDLRRVYEVVWGFSIDPRNFHRKVKHTAGFVVPTGETRTQETGRPAVLYRRGNARLLHPPMLRPSPEDGGR